MRIGNDHSAESILIHAWPDGSFRILTSMRSDNSSMSSFNLSKSDSLILLLALMIFALKAETNPIASALIRLLLFLITVCFVDFCGDAALDEEGIKCRIMSVFIQVAVS